MSECSVCERHGSCTRCIAALRTDLAAADEHVRSLVGEVAALRAGATEAEQRIIAIIEEMREQSDMGNGWVFAFDELLAAIEEHR
jgi:hypothetical protein